MRGSSRRDIDRNGSSELYLESGNGIERYNGRQCNGQPGHYHYLYHYGHIGCGMCGNNHCNSHR